MEDDADYTNLHRNKLITRYHIPRGDICRYLQRLNPLVGLVGVHKRTDKAPFYIVLENTEENVDALHSGLRGFHQGKKLTAKIYRTMDDLITLQNPYHGEIHMDYYTFMQTYVRPRRIFCSEFLLNV